MRCCRYRRPLSVYSARRPALPPARKSVVVAPGHRLLQGSYSNGTAVYRCECGVEQPPAPATTAAALRREHMEVHVARERTMLAGEPGQFAGRSIYEMLWDEMDSVYARLMAGEGARAKGDKGRAGGLAYALAVMTNPYKVDIEAIREQAHERWENGRDELDEANHAARGN